MREKRNRKRKKQEQRLNYVMITLMSVVDDTRDGVCCELVLSPQSFFCCCMVECANSQFITLFWRRHIYQCDFFFSGLIRKGSMLFFF